MIRLYDKSELGFMTNGIGILDLEAVNPVVREELNGIFKLEFDYPYNGIYADYLISENKLYADTPEGQQPFYISGIGDNNGMLHVVAYHVFYELSYDYIADRNFINKGVQSILTDLLMNTNFTGISDIVKTANVRVVRYNKVQFMLDKGEDNTILNRFGGEIVRDKYLINFKNKRGRAYSSTGLEIRYAKNLVDFKIDYDYSSHVDVVFPLGFNGLKLPELVVHRPNSTGTRTALAEYTDIKAIQDPKNPKEDELPLDQAIALLRQRVLNDFANGEFDLKFSSQVEFEMIQGVQAEYVYLGDEVRFVKEDEKIDLIARVISYDFDPVNKVYLNIELGNYIPKFSNINSRLSKLENNVKVYDSFQQATIEHVTNLMTSALGGYVLKREGELLIMDTQDPTTAQKIWRWNLNGLAYSGTGINGPYETAIMMDGTIAGKFLAVNSISANQLKSDVGQSLDLSSNVSVNTTVNNAKNDAIATANAYTQSQITQTADALRIDMDTKVNDINLLTKYNGQHLIDQAYQQDTKAIPFESNANIGIYSDSDTSTLNYLMHVDSKTTYSRYIPYVANLPYYYNISINPWGDQSAIYYVQILFYDGNKQELGANGLALGLISHATVAAMSNKNFEGYLSIPVGDVRNNARFIRIRVISRYTGSAQPLGNTIFTKFIIKQLSPQYLKTGYVEVTKDGLTVGDNITPVTSTLSANGLTIKDKAGSEIAYFTDTGAYTPRLVADKVISENVTGKIGTGGGETIALYVSTTATGDGTGRDQYNKANSIMHAWSCCVTDNIRFIDYLTITVFIDPGNYSENVTLVGIGGAGTIRFYFMSASTRWNGLWTFKNIEPDVRIEGERALLVRGDSRVDNFHIAAINAWVSVYNKILDGGDKTVCVNALIANNRAYLQVGTCDIVNAQVALKTASGSTGVILNCKGQVVLAMQVEGGAGIMSGTYPNGGTASVGSGFLDYSSRTSAVPSSYVVIPDQWGTTSRTFNGYLSSVGFNGAYSMNNVWAMGAYGPYYYQGSANFGNSIKSWLDSNGGYQNVTSIKIGVRRQGSGWSAVSPQIGSPVSQALNAVDMNSYVTTEVVGTALGNAILNNASTELKSIVTGSETLYMIADLINITITCQKKI